jgi:hypothetical protein
VHRGHVDAQQVGNRFEVGRQPDDGADVEIAVGPAIQPMPNTGGKGVVDGRLALRVLSATPP